MQGNLPKSEFGNIFENAEIVKRNLICFSFTESPEKKKKVYFSRWKSEEIAAGIGKLYLKDISERKLLRYVS